MRQALHDPVSGYYARRIKGIGHCGDFTTAPMLSDSLACAISAWAARAMKETGCRDLIEIGPGEGFLSAAVLRDMLWRQRWKTRLHLVETSAPLAEIQKKQLGRSATWHDCPARALAACGGKAVIFSNELVDAFPVRLFEKSNRGWHEVAVSWKAGRASESLMELAPLPPSSGFSEIHPVGQRIEVHASYREWLLNWLPHWKAGRLLTIDYGAEAETLYRRRPRGTLRGYLLQQRMEGLEIYQNPGRQDLTADVNFTDLVDWSAPWLSENKLQSLAAFLRGFHDPRHPADRALCDENDAGGAFSVLDQRCAASI